MRSTDSLVDYRAEYLAEFVNRDTPDAHAVMRDTPCADVYTPDENLVESVKQDCVIYLVYSEGGRVQILRIGKAAIYSAGSIKQKVIQLDTPGKLNFPATFYLIQVFMLP